MAAVTWLNVVDVVATVAALPVPLQTAILSLVNTKVNVEPFGGEADSTTYIVRCNLAAHFASILIDKITGPIISESEGELSTAYGQINMSSNFSATPYGQVYSTLAHMFCGGAWLATP